jgi:predicted ATP-binding protein involved in virulence
VFHAIQKAIIIMKNIFITKINVHKVRFLENMEIPLSDTDPKHLILTGKNGSGKTSLLEALRTKILLETRNSVHKEYSAYGVQMKLFPISNGHLQLFPTFDEQKKLFPNLYGKEITPPDVDVSYNTQDFIIHHVMFAYIPAKRQLKLDEPKTIEKTELHGQTVITNDLSNHFLKYILHLHYQLLSAQSDENSRQTEILKRWFSDFQKALAEIYNNDNLKLFPDAKNLTFKIEIPGYEPFGLNEMADGYSALLNIVMELLMRMDNGEGLVEYGKSGIIFVDEIETHLHVKLQKRVLPFLVKLFPNVQFIVSTHSPFVITSLENAVVFDLEKREILENPQRYSYETIIESYLDTDMYSAKMKEVLDIYKSLYTKERTPEENKKFLRAKTELELVPPASKEVYLAFHQLEAKRKEMTKNDKN